MTFGEQLAQERRRKACQEKRDILKKDVAEAVGASESSIGRWENGLTMPDDEMVKALAEFFGVTPAWLRYGVPPREPPIETNIPTVRAEPFEPNQSEQRGRKQANGRVQRTDAGRPDRPDSRGR